MKYIKNYITEKLHLRKGIKISKTNDLASVKITYEKQLEFTNWFYDELFNRGLKSEKETDFLRKKDLFYFSSGWCIINDNNGGSHGFKTVRCDGTLTGDVMFNRLYRHLNSKKLLDTSWIN